MARRIIELGVGDVDLVEGLWKELFAHHHGVTDGELPGRDPEESWRMRRAQYVEWLTSGEGMIFLVPGEGAEQAPLGLPACGSGRPVRPGTWARRWATSSRSRSPLTRAGRASAPN